MRWRLRLPPDPGVLTALPRPDSWTKEGRRGEGHRRKEKGKRGEWRSKQEGEWNGEERLKWVGKGKGGNEEGEKE